MTTATAQAIQYLNLAYFGRPSDPASLSGWPASGLTLNQIVLRFTATSEYATNTVAPNSVVNANGGRTFNDTNLINTFYQRLFGRLATSTEVAGWADALARGAVNYDYLGITILQAGLNLPAGTEMRNVLIAKFDSAQLYTGILFNSPVSAAAYSTAAAIQDGISYNLATNTTTPQTFAQATAAVATMVANSGAGGGATFTLTTAADRASANRFIGDLAVVPGFILQTLSNGDQLTGTGTNPTLNATILENGAVTTPASLANIETVNLQFSTLGVAAAAATTLNFRGGAAYRTLTARDASQAEAFNGFTAALSTVGIANTATNHTFTFTDAALAGTSNELTLTLDGVTGGNINFNATTAGASGYETLNLISAGTITNTPAQLNNGTAAGYTTLNISGAAAITIAAAATPNTVTTVNGSAATGVITYTAAVGSGAQAITGGTANDVINLVATYTTADTINGGAGTDRLTMNSAQLVAATAVQGNVSNIEVVGTQDALNGTVNVNFWGATGYRYGADSGNNNTINFAAGTSSLDFQNWDDNAAAGVTLVVTSAGVATTDVLNVTLGSTGAGTTFGNGDKTFTGFETLNIRSQGAANTFGGNVVLTNTAAAETINLTGSQNFTITGVLTADAINASGMSGTATLTLTGGAAGSISITGTANNDTLNGSGTADIISGGAGNDLISNQVAATVTASAGDVLTGGAGQDTFNLFGSNASAAYSTLLTTTSFVSDFAFSSTANATDIIGLSDTVTNYTAFGTALDLIVGAAAAAGATVIQSLAQNTTAVTTTANLLKLTTGVATAGLTVQQIFNSAIGAGSITGLTTDDGQFVTVYDTTNSQAMVMLASTGANNSLETADIVQLVGTVKMSAADYAAFDNTALLMNA